MPTVSQPIAAQLAVAQCVAAQPAVSRPVVAQPAGALRVAVRPATVLSAQPTQPATAQLAALQPTTDQPARPAGPATSTQPTIALTASTQHPASEADDVQSAALSSASAAGAVDADEMETVEGEGEALEECEGPAQGAKLRRVQGLGGGAQAARKQCGTPGCTLVSRGRTQPPSPSTPP